MKNMEQLSECEEKIMSILWGSDGDLNLETVTLECKCRYGKVWKLQTVATFMTRLEKKKYISIYRIGRYSHYHPIVSLEDYRKSKFEEICLLLFAGNVDKMCKFVEEM